MSTRMVKLILRCTKILALPMVNQSQIFYFLGTQCLRTLRIRPRKHSLLSGRCLMLLQKRAHHFPFLLYANWVHLDRKLWWWLFTRFVTLFYIAYWDISTASRFAGVRASMVSRCLHWVTSHSWTRWSSRSLHHLWCLISVPPLWRVWQLHALWYASLLALCEMEQQKHTQLHRIVG